MTRVGEPWLVVALVLSLTLALGAWAILHPATYAEDCERRYLPSREAILGFKGGRRASSGSGTVYTLVEVKPDGVLGKAGFASGDVPVEHHGGLADFCSAVHDAERGEARTVSVINLQRPGDSRRQCLVPSFTLSQP